MQTDTQETKLSPAARTILGEAIKLLRGVRNGESFDSFYFVGITMAAEKIMQGQEELAAAFYETAAK